MTALLAGRSSVDQRHPGNGQPAGLLPFQDNNHMTGYPLGIRTGIFYLKQDFKLIIVGVV